MRGFVAASARSLSVVSILIFGCVLWSGAHPSIVAAQAQTTVSTVICAPSSTITLTSPVNDSVVASSTVTVAGSVTQANQVNVFIDDAFDSVISVVSGHTTYTGSVHLSPGNHTIKVVAVNVCGATNGSASSVVTYTPPPNVTPSTGGNIPTNVGGVVISKPKPDQTVGGASVSEPAGGSDFGQKIIAGLAPVMGALQWLNIDVRDATDTQSMAVWRAVTVSAGLYLLIIGIVDQFVRSIVAWPIINGLFPTIQLSTRVMWLSRGFRLLGLLIILLALFL